MQKNTVSPKSVCGDSIEAGRSPETLKMLGNGQRTTDVNFCMAGAGCRAFLSFHL